MPLHPFIVDSLAAARAAGRPALSAGSPADARALVAAGGAALGPGPEVGRVADIELRGREGPIPARLFQPQGEPRGILVYLHGGGWVAGRPADFDALARHLCKRSGWTVLSVDYRLAPEHPFPAGLQDVEDALRWAWRERAQLAAPGVPLAVGGDSAGGNLATAAAASLKGELAIALQLLIYPVTDCGMDTPSYAEHGEGLSLTAKDMRWFFSRYADEPQWTDPRISPLRARDHTGAAPAWIATAEYDVLRDEAEAYARALQQAGVPVQWRRYEGVSHGFARMMHFVAAADDMVSDAAAALRTCAQAPQPTSPGHRTT